MKRRINGKLELPVSGTMEVAPNGDVTRLTCAWGHEHLHFAELFDCVQAHGIKAQLVTSPMPKRSGEFRGERE